MAATILQNFEDLRSDARTFLLVDDASARNALQQDFDRKKTEVSRLLRDYEDTLVSDDRDRRLTTEPRERTREWIGGAERSLALRAADDRKAAVPPLTETLAPLGQQVGSLMSEWLHHNEALATRAGQAAISTIERATRALLIAVLVALALSGVVGLVTYRRI